MLRHFGQTRNVYVATRIILLSSTAESSATGGYVAVPEHFLQKEEPACINKERTKKKPSFVLSYVSRQGKGKNRRNESTKERFLISLWLSVDCTDCD